MNAWQNDAWQNENVPCEFFCVRQRDSDNPEDMGSEFPDTECYVHWTPEWQAYRGLLHARRLARWRNWKVSRVARGR